MISVFEKHTEILDLLKATKTSKKNTVSGDWFISVVHCFTYMAAKCWAVVEHFQGLLECSLNKDTSVCMADVYLDPDLGI